MEGEGGRYAEFDVASIIEKGATKNQQSFDFHQKVLII